MPWLIWGISAAFVLYQFLLQSAISVMIPQLMHDLRINILDIGLLSSSFFYPYVVLQIPAGILVDRFGARILLICSISLCVVASSLFSLSHGMDLAEWSRILMGIASAPAVVCGMYLASRWFDKEKFAFVAGLVEMIGLFGGAVGQVCLAHLVTAWGWRAAMYVCVALALVLLLCTVIFVQNQCQFKPRVSSQKTPVLVLLRKFLAVVFIPQVWIACIYSGLMFSIVTGFAGLWSIPFLQTRYGISADKAATASALVFMGTALGTGAIGWFACRLGQLKIIMTSMALISFVLMTSIIFIAMPLGLMWIMLLLLGFSCGAYVLAFAMVKKNTCSEISATAMGFTNMVCIVLGAPVLQPLIGWILVRSSHGATGLSFVNYQDALIPLPVFLLLAFLVALWIKDKPCIE
ncbi:MAG: MFS transporter [Gammaproteobacteria bacterium]|nr:MFS transporter [Gammaproteobacteria bacterium]